MSLDPSKIFQSPCHCYLAVRSVRGTEVSHDAAEGWADIGLIKPKSAKIKQTEIWSKSHIGNHQIAVKSDFEVSALETDDSKKTIIEDAIGHQADILLVPLFGSRVWKIKGHEFMAVQSGEFSEDEPLAYDLKANATGVVPSDCLEEVSINWAL